MRCYSSLTSPVRIISFLKTNQNLPLNYWHQQVDTTGRERLKKVHKPTVINKLDVCEAGNGF